jgi:hypothetical protein
MPGSLWELNERTAYAKAFRLCCLELGTYVRNILHVFDGEGGVNCIQKQPKGRLLAST